MSGNPAWDPEQYLRFGEERLRPALDLLAHVAHPEPRRVVDLGCGAGSAMPALRARFPDAALRGVDGSAGHAGQGAGGGLRHGRSGHRPMVAGGAGRRAVLERGAALAARPRDAVSAPAGRSRAGRRCSGGADAAHARGAGARGAGPAGDGGPLGGAPARRAERPARARPRLVLRPAGAADGGARHLAHGVPARAARRRLGDALGDGQQPPALHWTRWTPSRDCATSSWRPTRRRCAASTRRNADGAVLLPFRRLFIVARDVALGAPPQQHEPRRRAHPRRPRSRSAGSAGQHRHAARVGGDQQVALRPAPRRVPPLPAKGSRRAASPQPRHHARVPAGAACGGCTGSRR